MWSGKGLVNIVVNNINLNEAYYYYSLFKPEPEAIDEFQAARIDAKKAAMLNFEKKKWTIAGTSDEEPPSPAVNIIKITSFI